MQIVIVPGWGFDHARAEYYGRRHSLHIGPLLILWGQMTDSEIEMWDLAHSAALARAVTDYDGMYAKTAKDAGEG